MKNNNSSGNNLTEKIPIKHFLLIMRTILILLLTCVFCSMAELSYTQNARVTINERNVALKEVLNEIESQTDYLFIYNDEINTNEKVSVKAKQQAVSNVLNMLLKGKNMNYSMEGNHIILSTMEKISNLKKEIVATEVTRQQQKKMIAGTVVDAAGVPIIGANIVEEGTTNGTVTDVDGKFTLNVDNNATIRVSYIGYLEHSVATAEQTNFNITLLEDTRALDELVVVGYGVQVREQLTGSISTISQSDLAISTSSDVVGRLQGKASGVTITSSNMPGGGSEIRIRGIGTINNPNPLYVIDGVPVGPSTTLDPNIIQSISILKDASSAAIYGTRGANGVIIITTKQGKKDAPPSVNINIRTGISRVTDYYNLLNPTEYGELVWLEAKNRGVSPSHPFYGSGSTPVIRDYILPAGAMEGDPAVDPALYNYPNYLIQKANKQGTDWFKEITQAALRQEYDVSVSGGTKNMIYAFSGNYLNEKGSYIYTGFDRFSFMSNTSAQPTKWLNIGETLNVSKSQSNGLRTDNSEASPISQTYRMQPIIPVYDIMGNYAATKAPTLGVGKSPVASLDRGQNNYNRNARILGSFFADIKILNSLSFRSTLGYNYNVFNSRTRNIRDHESAEPIAQDSYNQSSDESFQWNFSNVLNFDKNFNDFNNIKVILGTEAIENTYENMYAERSKYFSTDINYMRLSSGEINQLNSGSGSQWSLFSIFGRVNYNLMSKYFFETTVRRDGSSRFGSNNRYATFPAFSFAWALNSEKFMDWSKNWLDLAKARLGWGITGNDQIGEYNVYSTFDTHSSNSAASMTGSNTSVVMGFRPARIGNPNVTWETTKTLNLGLDFAALNNRLSFTIDIWNRTTTDMLYRISRPNVSGVATFPFVNVGNMENKGFDLELGYHDTSQSEQFRYGINLTLSHYKNEIIKLSENVNEELITGDLRQISYSRATTGTAFPEFYGYVVEGIFQTQEEADKHPVAFGPEGDYNKPGHFKFKDLNDDGIITPKGDMTYIGNPHPKLTGGFNINLGYKNFDLDMFFYGSYGNKMINYVKRWIDYPQFLGARSPDRLYKSWGSPYLDNNLNAKLPIADFAEGSYQPSTHFVEDGSFLRLKNVKLSYIIPTYLVNKYNLKGINVYLEAENLFVLTKYSGLDPELNAVGSFMGIDQGALPTSKRVGIGLSLTF